MRNLTSRLPLLDEARGLCLLLMLLYHGAYDLIAYCDISIPLYESPLLHQLLQPFFAALFILISGACCPLSRHPLRRGLLALGCGLAATAATLWAGVGLPDWFGILHFLGCMKLLYAALRRPLERIPPYLGALLGVSLFFLFYQLPYGALGWGPFTFPLPQTLYQWDWLFPLGLPGPGFSSSDYFPLLPWGMVFLAGVCLGKPLSQHPPKGFYASRCPALAWLGRHSLFLYLLHQPVLVFGLPPIIQGLRVLGLPI